MIRSISPYAFQDGTLTVPNLDFSEMRRRLGIPDGDLLAVINSWPSERQAVAKGVLAEIEGAAMLTMQPMPGAHELARFLTSRGLRYGLVRRAQHLPSSQHGHASCVGQIHRV